ncbi:hypothetical protein M413DRAFT_32865 [Hebeloma cylindrosporum]|uniref:Uncharacterized protein n=1 Tax=Hebeloma cylindrosporum TaxID=76867 RepID=A0A0C3BDU7_HEBCY|nr:hypothetical protein M413DRAFT_32865 [Hebeloma cylindrosporum h7]
MASYESGPSDETGEVNGDLGLYVTGSTHGDLNFGYIGRLLASEFVQPFLAPPAVVMFPSIAIPPLFLRLYPESMLFSFVVSMLCLFDSEVVATRPRPLP